MTKTRKIVYTITIALMVIMMTSLTGCKTSSSRVDEMSYQETLMQEAQDKVGNPNIVHFREREQAKEILELRDDADLICYAYTKSEGTGKYVYLGRCYGFGLPYSTQYTSPETLVVYNGKRYILPQADPNGLYLPDNMTATWLWLIDENTGESNVAYVEPEIFVSQSKLPERVCESWSIPADY